MDEKVKQNAGEAFKLERYKFILQQLDSLNQNHHKYLTLFQTLATAVVAGGVALFVGWRDLQIDAASARLGIRGLFGLLMILTAFLCFSIVAGIFSWIDYRREEVSLLDQEVGLGFRESPKLKNLWRWSEIHLLAFLCLLVLIIYIFLEYKVIPLIQ